MRHRPASLIAMTALVLAMVAWLPGVAVGQEDQYIASGEASGFAVDIPDVLEIATGRSEAEIDADLLAHGRGVGFLVADESISEVTIEQPGVSERDPAEGQNCAFPELPEPLNLVDAACSFALGSTTDALPRGLGNATGLELELTGADVVALVDFLLLNLEEAGLQEAINAAEDQVLGPIRTELENACVTLIEDTGISNQLSDLVEAIQEENPLPLDADLSALPEDNACAELLDMTASPPVIGDPTEITQTLRDQLAAALDGVSLLDVLLAGSVSEGVATTADATGTSDATGLDIALPSLNLLGNVVELLDELVRDFLDEVGDRVVSIELPEEVPTIEAILETVMEGIPEDLQNVLDDDQSLLRITGGQSVATAVYDRASGEVTTEGQVQPLVLDLADSLATLLGVSDQEPFSVPEGDSVTIAEGTPLETTANLATCTAEEATQDGLDGERISCAGLELTLLKGLVGDDAETDAPDGGINVAGASARAAAFGAPAPEPEEPAQPAAPELPTTGGGLALLGLIAVGSALALRRRS